MNGYETKAYLIFKNDLKFWVHAEVSSDDLCITSVTNLEDAEMIDILTEEFLVILHNECVSEAIEDGTLEPEGFPDWTRSERGEL
jgi:hypothetical protein